MAKGRLRVMNVGRLLRTTALRRCTADSVGAFRNHPATGPHTVDINPIAIRKTPASSQAPWLLSFVIPVALAICTASPSRHWILANRTFTRYWMVSF